jgi:hypothetical protein
MKKTHTNGQGHCALDNFNIGDRVKVQRAAGHIHDATVTGAYDERWNAYEVTYDESVLLSLNGRYVSADPYIIKENVRPECIRPLPWIAHHQTALRFMRVASSKTRPALLSMLAGSVGNSKKLRRLLS